MESRWKIQPIAWGMVVLLVGLKLGVHLLASGSYGYFRDELYFLDCARHLQAGYVDDTPGIALVAKAALLLGGSLRAVRLLAALGGAGTVLLTALLARELGGGRFAQGFAALCALAAPVFLAVGSNLCVGAFEPLFWMGCVLLVIRIARTGDSRLWLGFGVVAGLGLEMKYTMGLVLACLLVALVCSPLRRELRRPLFWAGWGVALLLFLPTALWQVRNHFPLLEAMETIRRTGKNVVLSPPAFLWRQIQILNVWLAPVWLLGLGSLLFLRESVMRLLGWFYLLLLAAMLALHGKDYYLAAIYPMLFAAGAVALESSLATWRWSANRNWPKVLPTVWAAALGLLAVPAILPLLPPGQLLAYQAFLGVKPERAEVSHSGPLEQMLGDQFGWPELAAEVARIYHALPPEERVRTIIFAGNYGEAGAINQFGPALGLPPAVCAHQAHSFWGPPAVDPVNVLCVGCSRESLEGRFDSVAQVGLHQHPWGMAEENRPLYYAKGMRVSLRDLWPRIKHWN